MEHWWNDTDREKTKILEKTLSFANFSTINHTYTYTAQVSNPGLCSETTIKHLRTFLPEYILQFTKHWYDLRILQTEGCQLNS
jgi:hypothetical protein